ncbi:MAG TPA: sulfite exporter TauE/SafE family protein [Longimicrobiales bacterium]|nr:sulfite exporter TauE/SafE family protein [Longimicrobiales bacterium]
MTIAALLALAVVGCGVGFLSGLVGIGGGVLIVPFLYFFYGHAEWSGVVVPESLHATMAHATSLFIIVPTAVVGTLTYARARLVAWKAVWPIAFASLVAAALGAMVASRVPQELLRLGFGFFLVFTAANLVAPRPQSATGRMRLGIPVVAVTGGLVGLLSALLGVGGGLVAIPLLMYVVRINVEQVAATSLAIVVVAATSGSVTYVLAGLGAPGLPSGSFGYVHMAAALPMLPGAMLAARLGARANQRMDPRHLRWAFAALFVVLGVRLVMTNLGSLLTR